MIVSWSDLEHVLARAVLGELRPKDALDEMLASLSKDVGGRCEMLAEHVVIASPQKFTFQYGSTDDPSAMTIVLAGDRVRETSTVERDRLKAMFRVVHELAYPFPRGAKSVHQLRNRLTGVLTNLELLEMFVDQEEGLRPEQLPELQVSIRHALTSCREMADIVRNLGGFVDSARLKKQDP
jgi:hypothetical protein